MVGAVGGDGFWEKSSERLGEALRYSEGGWERWGASRTGEGGSGGRG